MKEWQGKGALIVGAETETGEEAARVLASWGMALALATSLPRGEDVYQAQRLARLLAREGLPRPLAQVLDPHNEKAVQVTLRQVAKALNGLHLIVYSPHPRDSSPSKAFALLALYGAKEIQRWGQGAIIGVSPRLSHVAAGTRQCPVLTVENLQKAQEALLSLIRTEKGGDL